MKIHILKEKKNPFLKRHELVVDIEHHGQHTPSKAAVQQHIAKEKNKDVTSVEVVDINSHAGKDNAISNVLIWDEKKVRDYSKPAETANAETKEEKKE